MGSNPTGATMAFRNGPPQSTSTKTHERQIAYRHAHGLCFGCGKKICICDQLEKERKRYLKRSRPWRVKNASNKEVVEDS